MDSHTHLDSQDFDQDREAVIERARAAGVTRLITVGASDGFESAKRCIRIAAEHRDVWCSAGIHPQDAKTPLDPHTLETLARSPKVVAIGETGLDFYRDWAPREDQERWFRAQIELALALKKPLIIHCRDAGSECRRILDEMHAGEAGGVFHCFAEDAAFAAALTEINFLVSFPGTVTFKKADKLRQVVKAVPLEQMMVETDAPYMAPEPHRGKRCESAFVLETAKAIATLKGVSLEKLAEVTSANATRLFGLTEGEYLETKE